MPSAALHLPPFPAPVPGPWALPCLPQVRIELAYFQEIIYYWSSLRLSSALLAFTLLTLPLQQARERGRGRASMLQRAPLWLATAGATN